MKKYKTSYGIEKEKSIRVYPGKGVVIDGGYFRRAWTPDFEDAKRGKIKGWSRASRRRMRCFLVESAFPDGWQDFGVSLTIPGTDRENILQNWKELKRQFFQCLSRDHGWAGVWRLEIQSRGVPHLHCVMGRDMSSPLTFQGKTYNSPCGCQECDIPCKKSGENTYECRRLKWPKHCAIYDYFFDVWMHYLNECVPLPDGYQTEIKIKNINFMRGCKCSRTGRDMADILKEQALNMTHDNYPESYIFWRDEKGHTVSAFRPVCEIKPDFEKYYDERYYHYTTFDDRNMAGIENERAYKLARHMRDEPESYMKRDRSGWAYRFIMNCDRSGLKPFERLFDVQYLDVSGVDLAGARGGLQGAWASAVDIDCRGAGYQWLRYLQDHATKSKQAQIPENCGRHWGVFNRKKFIPADCETYVDLPDSVHAKVSRWVSRMCTGKIRKEGVPFGKKLGYRPSCGKLGFGQNVRFSNPETIQKMIMLAIELEKV